MVSYSSGLMMRAGRPGRQAYAPVDDGHLAEYANASGGTRATATIAIAGATAGSVVKFSFNARGQAPQTASWTVPAGPPTGQALYDSAVAAIRKNSFINGLGTFTPTTTNIGFASLEVGQNLTISGTGATVTATVVQGLSQGQALKPGTVAVIDPTVAPAARDVEFDSLFEFAMAPSQQLSDVAATQRWRGVVMESDSEMNFSYGGYPDFSNLDTAIKHPSVVIKEYGHTQIGLETPFTGSGAIPPLLYRYAADGNFTTTGTFSLTAGAGLEAVPVGYRIKRSLMLER